MGAVLGKATSPCHVLSCLCLICGDGSLQIANLDYVVVVTDLAQLLCPAPGMRDSRAYWHRARHICGFQCGACLLLGIEDVIEARPEETFASGLANHIFDIHRPELQDSAWDTGVYTEKQALREREKRAFVRQFCERFAAALAANVAAGVEPQPLEQSAFPFAEASAAVPVSY